MYSYPHLCGATQPRASCSTPSARVRRKMGIIGHGDTPEEAGDDNRRRRSIHPESDDEDAPPSAANAPDEARTRQWLTKE